MLSGPPRRRQARPVADASIDALLPHTQDLAKGWLLALLEQAPLGDAPAILAVDLTRDGPRLCDAVLRAISDDVDLRRLEPDGAFTQLSSRVGALAGASGPEAASRAVEALQAVIWTALRDQLVSPDPDLVVALSERLTRVVELLRAATLRSIEGRSAGEPVPGPAPQPSSERRWPREVKSEERAQALWVGALQEEIHRCGGAPLALLLAELEEAERVAAVESDGVASSLFGDFARVVRGVVRHQDILVAETETRAWIIARDTGRSGAVSLALRIADAVRGAGTWRGAPLAASVGLAVLGEDGHRPDELIDAAEEARYAAAARGVSVSGVGDQDASERR